MRATASPNARLVRALERRSLAQAEEAARELAVVDPEHALALILLMLNEHDSRWERSAVRWVGQWLADRPATGLELAADLIGAFADLDGASPDVARARVAFVLRSAGGDGPASVLERW